MNQFDFVVPLTEEMLEKLSRLVKFDSKYSEPLPGKPFGEGPAAALEEGLKIANEMGFRTKNLDNYCGYAEIGEGQDIIGIAAHLDIVPAGDGWDTDPFTLTRIDEKVYGRGVSDDKGAVIASLYAMKLIQESGIPLTKRIRLLMGCNEESGSKCMSYYNEHDEAITLGFTPDGNFPGIYGEKGPCAMLVHSKKTKIISMNGGFVFNAVCNHCTTAIPANEVDISTLENALKNTPLVSFEITEQDDAIIISAEGISAHASTPEFGVNAASYTMKALQDAGFHDDFVDFYMEHIGVSCDGIGIGLKVEDAYGPLTLNNGIVKTDADGITCTIDIRYPVTLTPDDIYARTKGKLESDTGSIEILHVGKSLFHDPNSPLVQSLYDAYVDVTGDTVSKPMVIGGGTYAKSIPGIIAFGCEFPNDDNHIHDKNESLPIKDLQRQVAIYMKAIQNLMKI